MISPENYSLIYNYIAGTDLIKRVNGIKTRAWLLTISLMVMGVLICYLRNPYPLSISPFLYAEDAGWSGLIINEGLFYALRYGRLEYPIFFPVLLNFAVIQINTLIFGDSLSHLAKLIAISSYMIWTLTSLICFNIVRIITGSIAISFFAFLFVIHIPVDTLNSAIGANLQWGHVAYFYSISLTFFYLKKRLAILTFLLLNSVMILSNPAGWFGSFLLITFWHLNFSQIISSQSFSERLRSIYWQLMKLSKQEWPFLLSLIATMSYMIWHSDLQYAPGSADVWANPFKYLAAITYRPFLFSIYGAWSAQIPVFINFFASLGTLVVVIGFLSKTKSLSDIEKKPIIAFLLASLFYSFVVIARRGGVVNVSGYDAVWVNFYFYSPAFLFAIVAFTIFYKFPKLGIVLPVLFLAGQTLFNTKLNYHHFNKGHFIAFMSWEKALHESYEKNIKGKVLTDDLLNQSFAVYTEPASVGAYIAIPTPRLIVSYQSKKKSSEN